MGKVLDASNVPLSKGDACEVSIDPKAKKGTVMFRLNGRQIYVERDEVEKGLATGKKKVKLQTTGEHGGNAFVVLKFDGGQLNFMRLKLMSHRKRWTIACGDFQRS